MLGEKNHASEGDGFGGGLAEGGPLRACRGTAKTGEERPKEGRQQTQTGDSTAFFWSVGIGTEERRGTTAGWEGRQKLKRGTPRHFLRAASTGTEGAREHPRRASPPAPKAKPSDRSEADHKTAGGPRTPKPIVSQFENSPFKTTLCF